MEIIEKTLEATINEEIQNELIAPQFLNENLFVLTHIEVVQKDFDIQIETTINDTNLQKDQDEINIETNVDETYDEDVVQKENLRITWILQASTEGINLKQKYHENDDRCLSSQCFSNKMVNIIKNNGFDIFCYENYKINKYKFGIICDLEDFESKIEDFINFKSGRYRTYKLYKLNENNQWIKIYSKN